MKSEDGNRALFCSENDYLKDKTSWEMNEKTCLANSYLLSRKLQLNMIS